MPLGMRHSKGWLWRGDKLIYCFEEEDLFKALGIPFVALDMRDNKEWLEK